MVKHGKGSVMVWTCIIFSPPADFVATVVLLKSKNGLQQDNDPLCIEMGY